MTRIACFTGPPEFQTFSKKVKKQFFFLEKNIFLVCSTFPEFEKLRIVTWLFEDNFEKGENASDNPQVKGHLNQWFQTIFCTPKHENKSWRTPQRFLIEFRTIYLLKYYSATLHVDCGVLIKC